MYVHWLNRLFCALGLRTNWSRRNSGMKGNSHALSRSAGEVLQESVEIVKDPSSWSELYEKLEDKFCEPAKLTKSSKKAAKIVGEAHPHDDVNFSHGLLAYQEPA